MREERKECMVTENTGVKIQHNNLIAAFGTQAVDKGVWSLRQF